MEVFKSILFFKVLGLIYKGSRVIKEFENIDVEYFFC